MGSKRSFTVETYSAGRGDLNVTVTNPLGTVEPVCLSVCLSVYVCQSVSVSLSVTLSVCVSDMCVSDVIRGLVVSCSYCT